MEKTPHQNVTFPSAGGQAHGYLALPEGGKVMVTYPIDFQNEE